MKTIKYFFLAVLLVPSILWLFADTLFPQPFTYFSFRSVFVQYSGIIAVAIMSIAMLLAMRPKRLEPFMNGLDKMYRLHKWLGIAALSFAVTHWWFAKGTKWMVGWGWLVKPERKHRGSGESLGFWQDLLHDQRGFAESVGEWAFYAAALLITLALIKRFPYRWFVKTHTLLAVAYLAFVYHSVVLIKFDYWSQPIGWLMAALLLAGTVAAIWVLLGKVGAKHKVNGEITSTEYHSDMRVLEVTVKLDEGWKGHNAGQFAFATSDLKEGAHPYTIASAWDPQTRLIKFIIKELGDHTERLKNSLSEGMIVTVEGPYGRFDFQDKQPQQIWIGSGIGITPFVARMKKLAEQPNGKKIDFFHPTTKVNDVIRQKLAADVSAANVNFYLLDDTASVRLDAEQIRAAVPNWQSASIWFCGPPSFGESLRKDFLAKGFPEKHFHQELFQFR